jgi:hypothetical protein
LGILSLDKAAECEAGHNPPPPSAVNVDKLIIKKAVGIKEACGFMKPNL